MIYYGMEPKPSLGAKMALTSLELRRLNRGKLRNGCKEDGQKYICYYRVKENNIRIGSYSSIDACNQAWDLTKELYAQIARLKHKGYQSKKYPNGLVKHSVKLADGWKQFDDGEEARAAYELMVHANISEIESKIKGLE